MVSPFSMFPHSPDVFLSYFWLFSYLGCLSVVCLFVIWLMFHSFQGFCLFLLLLLLLVYTTCCILHCPFTGHSFFFLQLHFGWLLVLLWSLALLTESIQELKEFNKTANDIHPNIQVDLKSSTSSLEFLDVLIEVKESEIQTSLYNNHLYLHAKSDHPRTTKKAIPYGLGIRAKRICFDHNQYWKERQEIKKHLKTRIYRSEDVETSLKKSG